MSSQWDKDFIAFSKNTRIGVLIILTIFLIVAMLPRIIGHLTWEKPLITSEKKLSTKESETKQTINYADLKVFDPNDLSIDEWMDLGLSEKQAKSVINFKEKIGGFKDALTFKKSYGISDQFYSKIESKIKFKSVNKQNNLNDGEVTSDKKITNSDSLSNASDSIRFRTKAIEKIEINSASYDELIQIKGIGNYFAEQIIDLRIRRGGLTSLNQLLEIPYFNEEKLEKVLPSMDIDQSKVLKINLNKATLKQLSRHPDITWDMARSIIDLRTDLGTFESLDQILLSAHVDLRRFNHLKKYLTIE